MRFLKLFLIMSVGVFILFCFSGCDEAGTATDPDPCDCEANTPEYEGSLDPGNIYLDQLVESEWNPGTTGSQRIDWTSGGLVITDENGVPQKNGGALGPPEGGGTYQSGGTYTCVGIGGNAAWRFEEGWHIYDGDEADFVTFASNFAWDQAVDGLVCELAHVEVSEDLVTWYYNSNETYVVNPQPSEDNPDYQYRETAGVHGNNPTWANYETSMQAQEIQTVDGVEKWVDIDCECISIYFAPADPHLGGVAFDLSDFRSHADDSPWPVDGKMKYIKIIDNPSILDGQDYDKEWCLGANVMSAMGINVRQDD